MVCQSLERCAEMVATVSDIGAQAQIDGHYPLVPLMRRITIGILEEPKPEKGYLRHEV
jgi:hypothetical protein